MSLNLTAVDIIADFGVTIELTNARLSGTLTDATLSTDVALRINGVSPPFAVPVQVTAESASFGTVATRSITLETQGSFATSAVAESPARNLQVFLRGGISGLFSLRSFLRWSARHGSDCRRLPGWKPNSQRRDRFQLLPRCGSHSGRCISRFELPAKHRFEIKLTGAGILQQTTLNTGLEGGGIVEYHPPVAHSPGTAIVTVVFDDGGIELVSDRIVIQYEATSASARAATLDGSLARDRIALIIENLPTDDEGNSLPPDEAAIEALALVLREWFRGSPDHPEVGSVQSRLEFVQPGASEAPDDYTEFRNAVADSIRNFQDWEAKTLELLSDDSG